MINENSYNQHAAYFFEKCLVENKSQAKQYVQQGKLTAEELNTLLGIDPSPTKKYVGWMAKQWIVNKTNSTFTLDDLRNNIEEYHSFAIRNKVKTLDINGFKSFAELHAEVDELNKTGAGYTSTDLENDFEVVLDDANFYIAVPHTHQASRKLGLSKFAFRDCEGGKDSAWCTTYKAPNHFNDYYYKKNITFYYILVKNEDILNKLIAAFPNRGMAMKVVALALYDNNSKMYDGADKLVSAEELKKYKEITGLN